ncbi:DUF6221 family protein [Streptomyces sp. NPDC049590]|uniref:DUF6221 family protein n=1 Tax=Streptomyces sp. NPDC049590 TaxID=3154834 RepID=UPI00341C766E
MDELMRWLGEQMDKDERTARAACWDEQSDVWIARPPQGAYEQYTVVDYLDDGVVAVTPENADDDGVGQHVAEWDPRRVLREIDAKRGVLDLYATAVEDRVALRARMREVLHADPDEFGRLHQQEFELMRVVGQLTPVVRLLVLPYADRPGCREEWKP